MGVGLVGDGELTFKVEDWWALGHHDGSSDGWAHHGIAVTTAGDVVTFDEGASRVQVIDPDGTLLRTFSADVTEAHGLLVVCEAEEDQLWICDNGSKQRRQASGEYLPSPKPLRGSVVLVSLAGGEIRRLAMPDLPMYTDGDYCPGAIAVDEQRFAGSGDIWVADCYGQSVVHRFDVAGRHQSVLDGMTGAGRFHHPHSLWIDRRGATPVLLVADRGNRRIQVFGLDGTYIRSFGADYLLSPGGLAVSGEYGPDGPVRPALTPGEFHTPHGIAAHPNGTLYIAEWLIGGRLVRVTPQ
jgi:hypothetical protein